MFNFNIVGDQISGYTVELIKQAGGNLETHQMYPISMYPISMCAIMTAERGAGSWLARTRSTAANSTIESRP